jgi:glucokinase
MLLVGDIGGTNTRLALLPEAKAAGKATKAVRSEVLESAAHPSLESALRKFLGKKPPRIKAACFGIAGPVVDQKCTATNLPWVVDAKKVAAALSIGRILLVNDLVALARGAVLAPRSRLRSLGTLGIPKKKGANLAILAAGTGLGEAALVWDGERFVPLATEGGHGDFAPRNDLEAELLRFLRARFGRVSYERILSGPGIRNLYEFFRDEKGMGETEENAARLAAADDFSAEVSKLATELGPAPACKPQSATAAAAIDLFGSLYGAEAGNMVLRYFAFGGVYVAGGIASFLQAKLAEGEFLQSFTTKGRFTPLLEKTPVAIVTDSTIGLRGAAAMARELL